MGKGAIQFKLFGGFSYRTDAAQEWMRLDESLPGGSGKKLRSFLEYLIIHHSRDITTAELVEEFWPESQSSSPASALKHTIHKARLLLKAMFPDHDGVRLMLDTEQFERLCMSDKSGVSPQSLPQVLEAIALYEGNLLPTNEDDWILSLRTYYHSLYINVCKNALLLLQAEGRWAEMATICERAYTLDPGIEEFTLYFMQALVALEQPERALEQYETFRLMLWEKFGLIPTERIEKERAIALELRGGKSLNNLEIFQLVTEESEDLRAFSCSFSVFRSIVHLEKRHCRRENRQSSIVIVGIVPEKGKEGLPSAPSATDIRRVERILLDKLRAGDPVTRLSMGSFLVLLSGASTENTHHMMERISTQFRKAYPRSKARLTYESFPLL